jgi:sugar-specific transcriptional regulator TrmB
MIVEKNFLNKLKDFGLNSYEAKLWTALLSRGVSTAGELSDIANVPRSRTYDVLESLEKKGFIIMKIGKPIKYLAVEPKEVVKRVQKSIKDEADTRVKLIDELKDSEVLSELSLLHNQGIDMVNPTDLSGSFKGRDSSYDHLDAMFKVAEKAITLVSTQEGIVHKMAYFKRTLEKAAERGVTIRIAVEDMTKDFNVTFAEVRKIPKLKSRFAIVDGEQVMFMLLDSENVHPNYDAGVWVNSPFFAEALETLFEYAWKEMEVVSKA